MYSTYYKTTKKKTVAKLKVTRKLEEYLPAFSIVLIPYWYYLKYISHFSNISAIPPLISAIFSLYRRFDTGYRLTDIFGKPFLLYTRHHNKRSYPHGNFFSYTPSSTYWNISAIFQIYQRFLHLYQRFFIISTFRHRISIYRHPSTLNIPYPQAIYCRTLRLKR